MAAKKPTQSKALWFNILSIITVVLTALLADETFRELIGSNAVILIVLQNIINIGIRLVTSTSISTDPEKVNHFEWEDEDDGISYLKNKE